MARTYAKLRGVMREQDDTQEDLARMLLMTKAAVSQRFNNRTPWKLDEMYAIMDRYRLPYESLHEIFPRDGLRTERASICTRCGMSDGRRAGRS